MQKMMMEEKLVISELELGKDLANRLMSNLKHTSSSSSSADSNKTLISEILRVYQNAIFMLSLNEHKNTLKRRSPEIDNDKDSKIMFKKRKTSDKKTEKVKVFVTTGQENGSIEDGHCWRKYGQKEIHGSKNPRAYYRCTHRFTQNCVAVKQVQKSDTDPSVYEVKYLGNHTCNNIITSPKSTNMNFSVSMFEEGRNRVNVTEKSEDMMKPKKSEEAMMINLEDLENKKNIFRTFSFLNHEFENGEWKSNLFLGELSPATSGSGITSEIVTAPASLKNSETADSYFSSLDNIIDQDWLWSAL
ncbi:PREDICTED: probable WRKY transcription factor 46 [Camelina sativa]|uniref:Probable WRKY transcription factor 46 n=1 Tax=Camelina sativa TaxID=90675 RepID=A0ABM0YYS4_CAMSA|nr:PREDICTED: probable WRKY transcription factor 46 [Camelina sativa]